MTKQKVQNRDVNAANRVALALSLRAKKISYEEIAHQCGYGSAAACYNAIQRELQRVVVTNVEELRREEADMLDRLHAEAWDMVMDRENEKRLFAIDRVLSISKARRELFGIDMQKDANVIGAQVVVREMPPGYLGLPEVKDG